MLAGIGLMLAGMFLFSINDVMGKWLVATYSVGQLLLIRSVAALLLLAPFVWREGIGAYTNMERPGLQALRALLSTAEVAFFYWAVAYLPLADVVTFYLAGPIYVTALSVILLGEHVGWRRWTAVIVGFIGVLIALRPSAASFTWPALIALAGSVFFAFLMIITRMVRGTSDAVLVGTQTVGALVVRRVCGAVRLGGAELARFSAAVAPRHHRPHRACLHQSLAQARAGVDRGAVPVHAHHLGGRIRICRIRRRAGGAPARGRGHHRGGGHFHLPARASHGAAGPAAGAARAARVSLRRA